MPFLPILHQAAVACGTTGLTHAALVAVISLPAPRSSRVDAREILKIPLRRNPYRPAGGWRGTSPPSAA